MYRKPPIKRQKIAVLVPDVNIEYKHAALVIIKNILSFFKWAVILNMKNNIERLAILQPKFAASEKNEKYLVVPPTMCVLA